MNAFSIKTLEWATALMIVKILFTSAAFTMRGPSQYWKLFFQPFLRVWRVKGRASWSFYINPNSIFCSLWLIRPLPQLSFCLFYQMLLLRLSAWSHLRCGTHSNHRGSLIGSATLIWPWGFWSGQKQKSSTVDIGPTVVSPNVFCCCFLNVKYILTIQNINFSFDITP